MFRFGWPEAPENALDAITHAVSLSERAAGSTTCNPDACATAAKAADEAANAADDGNNRVIVPHPDGTVFYANALATDSAYAAVYAVNAVFSPSNVFNATSTVETLANNARGAFDTAAYKQAIRRDYDLLLAATTSFGWTDDTPVPPEFFGPMWPEGEPEGWPSSGDKPKTKRKLFLQIAVPADTPDDELDETVAKLARAASELHAAHGGSGLVVTDQRVYETADIPAGVGT